MSAWTNVSIESDRDTERRLALATLKAELAFWKEHARELQATLENIPATIKQWGEVEIQSGAQTLKLVAAPTPSNPDDPRRGESDG